MRSLDTNMLVDKFAPQKMLENRRNLNKINQ